MLVSRCVCAATAFLLAGSFPSQSLARTLQDRQATPPPRTETQPAAPQSVKVFIDCLNVSCDSDFLRTDISFVDHVRDRKDADVHVLITSESTGGGGQKYTVSVMGLRLPDGVDHLVHYRGRRSRNTANCGEDSPRESSWASSTTSRARRPEQASA